MPRTFTVDEANALVPELTGLVTGMRERRERLEELRQRTGERAAPSGNGYLDPEREAEIRRAEALAQEINDLFSKLNDLGCELKGLDEGLVDFLSERDGRPVYLCWKLGEDQVRFWHELDAGFAGRQPL